MALVPPKHSAATQLHPKPTTTKEELSLKHFSDEVVTGHIYIKHREDDKSRIDVDNYISLVENIITIADRITDTVSRGVEGHVVFSDDTFKSNVSIDPPICTLDRFRYRVWRLMAPQPLLSLGSTC